MPDVGIQVPPNLSDWWVDLVEAGATDLGGLSANGDHISPEHPFPSPLQVRKRLRAARLRADRAALRLPAVHEPGVDRAGRARRGRGAFPTFIPRARFRRGERHGRPRRPRRPGPRRHRARAARARARAPTSWRPCSPRRGRRRSRRSAPAPTACARSSPATWRRSSSTATSTSRTSARSAARSAASGRQPVARRLRGRPGEFAERVREAVAFGATEICMQGGHPPRLRPRPLRPLAAAGEGGRAGDPPPRVLADGGPLHVRALRARPRLRVRLPARPGPRLDAGHRGRGPRGRGPQPDLAEQAARPAAGSRSSRPRTGRACDRRRP